MKNSFLLIGLGLLLSASDAGAQGIKIMPGTTFRLIESPYQIVLYDGARFENNSPVNAPLLAIKASGNATNQISGTSPLTLQQLMLSKTAGQLLQLQKDIDITANVTFGSGLLDLNNHNINLQDTAVLIGESETSRVIGSNGGWVQSTANLDAPLAENPGNLGLYIVSGANWGNTIIRRRHGTYAFLNGGSIARSFEVIPTNNSGLFAFLRAYYMDAELNAVNESNLNFFQSDDGGSSWTDRGNVSRNSTQNFVNINGLQTMSLFTLGVSSSPLPMQLTSISSTCINNKPRLEWTAENTKGIDHFQVEKSKDSRTWLAAGNVVQTQSSPQYRYQFIDASDPFQYYRLKAIDADGSYTLSSIQSVNCQQSGSTFSLLENPVRGTLLIGVSSGAPISAKLTIYDMQGKEMLSRIQEIGKGSSQLTSDVSLLIPGIYQLKITEGNELIWGTRFIKP